jgi:hypothetical protein
MNRLNALSFSAIAGLGLALVAGDPAARQQSVTAGLSTHTPSVTYVIAQRWCTSNCPGCGKGGGGRTLPKKASHQRT